MIDIRIGTELANEGLARNIIRQIQEHRKNSGLNMEDRIALYLHSDSTKLMAAIDAHREHIAAETLATKWSEAPIGEVAEVKLEGEMLSLYLRKTT